MIHFHLNLTIFYFIYLATDRSGLNSSFKSNSSSELPLSSPNSNTLSIKLNESIIPPSSSHRSNSETNLCERLSELRKGLTGTNGSPHSQPNGPSTINPPNFFVSTTTGNSVSSILTHPSNSPYAAALASSHPNYSALLSNGYYPNSTGPYLNSSIVPPPLLYSHLCGNRGPSTAPARSLSIETSLYSSRNLIDDKLSLRNVHSSEKRNEDSNNIDNVNNTSIACSSSRNLIVDSNQRPDSVVEENSDINTSANNNPTDSITTNIFSPTNVPNTASSDSNLWRPY